MGNVPKISFPIYSSDIQNARRALGFMCNKKPAGYMTCLKSFIGKDLIDEFKSVGFLKSGYCRKGKTYSITELGKQYFKDIS